MGLEVSPIRALNYQILRSTYEVLDLDKPGAGLDELNFQYDTGEFILQDDGAERLDAKLDVRVTPSAEDPSGYKLNIAVRGIFVSAYMEEGGSRDDFEMFMKLNAFTLLYSFVRSHVQILTSMSPSGQICLPCIDAGSVVSMLTEAPS